MLLSWTLAERFETNPYRDEEQIIVYTPYLLTALDTAERADGDTSVSVANAKDLVARFDGVLVVRAIINAPLVLNDKELEVRLVQEGSFVTPYHSDFLDGQYLDKMVSRPVSDADVQKKLKRMEKIHEQAAELQKQLDDLKGNKIKPTDIELAEAKDEKAKAEPVEVKQKICRLQYNFYFDQAEFDPGKPYLILIKDAYCGGREFAVDPALLK